MQAPPTERTQLNPTEAWWAALSARDDRSALGLLQTEIAGGRSQRSVYALFSEMEEKDGHLYSVMQTRLNGLLGLRRRIVPASDASAAARERAAFASVALDCIPRFEAMLRALLDGIAKGFAVVELVWGRTPDGKLAIVDWIAHPQEWFAFDEDGELLLLTPPFRGGENAAIDPLLLSAPGRSSLPAAGATRPPERKFIALRFGADARNPYGRGLALRAYWYYWFKKNTLKFWAIYNEKFGAPTAVASYAPGTPAEERTRLRELLDSLQTDSSVVLPESVTLSLLEAGRAAGADTYREFLDWCNDETSRIVLGATLTSGEGRRSGSLALGSIHQLVRQDYIDADARLLEGLVNETLLRWLVELNFGNAADLPRMRIETESPQDLVQRLAVDKGLLSLGVALPQGYFYEQYGRPAPTGEDAPLRYDDANFYQYHLEFGVLTVNEVRARLGLGEVPWGSRRTGDAKSSGRGSTEDNGGTVK